jgi:hypothetical protein
VHRVTADLERLGYLKVRRAKDTGSRQVNNQYWLLFDRVDGGDTSDNDPGDKLAPGEPGDICDRAG